MLNHGGQLRQAQRQYPLAPLPWLDLSTGIAPWTWPVPSVPVEVWQRLPEGDPELAVAARGFYRSPEAQVLAVSGSQAAIEKIPTLVPRSHVALPLWGYAEHQKAWRKAGHQLHFYRHCDELSEWIDSGKIQHAVVINPNNPSAQWIEAANIERWQQRLQSRDGYLLVDEAFADALPQQAATAASLIDRNRLNLIVLRSVGKFFGLAGLRLGFVLGSQAFIERLQTELPLWDVAHPAQWLGVQLLNDAHWHQQQRQRIENSRRELESLLRELLPLAMADALRSSTLFVSLFFDREALKDLHRLLAEQGIWVRFFEPQEGPAGLRFGLTDQQGLARLRAALTSDLCRFF
ncbi:MAG: threonine-phosphate decarboxylase CobD [Cellvibrionaceae bacterium]